MPKMEFVIPGKPVPCPRPRINRTTGNVYYPGVYKLTLEGIRLLIRSQMNEKRWKPLEGEVEVSILCVGASKKADWDNLGKTYSDALTGSALKDDVQIKAGSVDIEEGKPETRIVVKPR